MFYQITNTIKKIFIREIKDLVKDHPEFSDVLVINKFQDQEREKCNIIVRSASASSQRMSLDNFGLTVQSYTILANLKGHRGDMIEWIRDDLNNIQNLVPPGFYIIKMNSITEFMIEQFLTINQESLSVKGISSGGQQIVQLRHQNVNPGSELIVDGYGRRFVRDLHYTINYSSSEVVFLIDFDKYYEIKASYQYIQQELGPFEVKPYTMNNTALPGVVLAFGDRLREGDIQVVVVSEKREDSARATTGRWNMSIDITVMAQDSDTSERLIDFVGANIWAVKQIPLADRGITIQDISLSGESEEPELDTPDEWNFSNTLSLTVLVDWELHVPMIERIRNIFVAPPIDTGIYTDEELHTITKNTEQSIDYKTFGTVDEGREGRYYDFNEGSRHFAGLIPVQSVKSVVVSPNIIF